MKKANVEMIMKAVLAADEESKAKALDVLTGTSPEVPSRNPVEPYLTLKETAKRLNVHVTSLWRWKIPGYDLGGRRRFRISEVEKYLESPEFKARVAELKAERKAKSQKSQEVTNG